MLFELVPSSGTHRPENKADLMESDEKAREAKDGQSESLKGRKLLSSVGFRVRGAKNREVLQSQGRALVTHIVTHVGVIWKRS